MLRHIITLTLTNDPPLTLRTYRSPSFSFSLSLSLFLFFFSLSTFNSPCLSFYLYLCIFSSSSLLHVASLSLSHSPHLYLQSSVHSRLARLLPQSSSLHPSISSLLPGSNPRYFDSRGLQPPSPRLVGPYRGQYRRPCTLDTLRLRCLITQDTSSKGESRVLPCRSPHSLSFALLRSLLVFSTLSRTNHPHLQGQRRRRIAPDVKGPEKKNTASSAGQNISSSFSLFPLSPFTSNSSRPDQHGHGKKRLSRIERRNEISLLTRYGPSDYK